MTSVERINEYANLPVEESANNSSVLIPPADWPALGAITIQNMGLTYGDEPVLHDLSLSIKSHEKIGVVGRTGAGKSRYSVLIHFGTPCSSIWYSALIHSVLRAHLFWYSVFTFLYFVLTDSCFSVLTRFR